MKNKQQLPKNAKKVFKGKIFNVYQWKQRMFDNSVEVFEKIKRTDTAVVIPVVGNNKILIQKQEQPHRKGKFLSLPGGRCEKNEKPLFAAKREMLEETGYASKDWELWKAINPLEKIVWTVYIYIARNCEKTSEQKLDAGEKIKTKLISFQDFLLLSENKTFYEQELRRFLYDIRLYPAKKQKFRKLLFGK